MKLLKKICNQFNIFAQCKKYNLPLQQCPPFLFSIMGIVIIASSLIAYIIGTRYIDDPLLVALLILILVTILLIIDFVVTRGVEELAEANRMKSEFISIATHQLRSPLANLRWVAELLLSGKIGEIEKEQLEYFKILKENIKRMQELISDLLIVSRIEAAKLLVKKEEFSIKNLVENLISGYRSFAEASNVEIFLDVEKDLPSAFSDPFQIKLIIKNLLDNAIRYTKGKGRVEINISKKGKDLYFLIKDNGVGIPQKDQRYIFQKFYRSRNVLRYQTQGSGLGLYISRAIIKNLKGKIGFESKENIGSTFWFSLPIKS